MTSATKKIRWGIIGPGGIAKAFAGGVAGSRTGELTAIASRNPGKAGTFLGEAFMYRLHPQTLKLVGLIRSGTIGEVRMIKSSFGFAMPRFMPEHRLYANELAGGGILDVGGYPVSMARLIAGAAAGQPFLEPDKVAG